MNRIDKIIKLIRSLKEEAPTVSIASGGQAGIEPGETPPVKRGKKKRYIYGGSGSRKFWINKST